MSDKNVHIVFQVLNFLRSAESLNYNLLPIDRLLLIFLASHSGSQGIFPNQQTLTNEIHTSLRYTKTRLKYLESTGLISINRIKRKNHYTFNFIHIGDPQITYQSNSIGDPQITSQVIHRSPHRGSTDHTNRNNNNLLNNRESSLSNFKPDESNIMLAKDLRLDLPQEIESFKNRHKGKASQYEFSRWLKAAKEYQTKNGNGQQAKCSIMEWAPGHPDYDRRHGIGAGSNGMQIPRSNGRGSGSH